ncbi:MAG: DMP19 family protein [Prevotella sp.]|nr:DMP19 family protein [Prevotella sp.]
MKEVKISDKTLKKAAAEGMDDFVNTFINAINEAIGGELGANNMKDLNSEQITLLAYHILQEEVMDGGFIQLIHNGYGGFIFHNPFAKMMRLWGLDDLAKIINKAHKLYDKYHERIEKECSDEEFMAMFEQMPEFDDIDDNFVENEEKWTEQVACYIDEHIQNFVTII